MGEESTIEKLFKNMDKNGDGLVTKEVRLQRRRPLGNWDYGILCGYKNSNFIGTESFKVHCTLHFFSFYDKILTVLTSQFICKRIWWKSIFRSIFYQFWQFLSNPGIHDNLQEPDRWTSKNSFWEIRHKRGRQTGLQRVLWNDQQTQWLRRNFQKIDRTSSIFAF